MRRPSFIMPNEPPAKLIETRPVLEGDPTVVHPDTGMPLGRPPRKYTRAVHDVIVQELKRGQRPQGACARAGITVSTFYDWVNRGKSGDPHLFEFAEDVEIAFNTAEAEQVDVIQNTVRGEDPELALKAAQWSLERTRADGYSKQVKTAVEGQILQFMQRLEKTLDAATFEKVLAVYMGHAPSAAAELEAKVVTDATEDDSE